MNMQISAGAVAVIAVGIGLVVVAGKLKAPAAAVADALNPTSPNNLAYRGANSIVRYATGDPYASVGTKWWEFANPTEAWRERQALGIVDLDQADRDDLEYAQLAADERYAANLAAASSSSDRLAIQMQRVNPTFGKM